ncbi:MAG: helix-turn-helix domain-containing protein [Alphaproteobacteria bacterium]
MDHIAARAAAVKSRANMDPTTPTALLLIRDDGTRKSMKQTVAEIYAATIKAAKGNKARAGRMLKAAPKIVRKRARGIPDFHAEAPGLSESLPAHSVLFLTKKNGARKSLSQLKGEIYAAALEAAEGHQALAAHALDIDRTTLYRHRDDWAGQISKEKKASPRSKPLVSHIFFQAATELTARLQDMGMHTVNDLGKKLIEQGIYKNTNSVGASMCVFLRRWQRKDNLSKRTSIMLPPVGRYIVLDVAHFKARDVPTLMKAWRERASEMLEHKFVPEPPSDKYSGPASVPLVTPR